ncbi:hydroxysteroid 11-beta-dehydrogenase 1-like protein [Branchiostoma floridae]|uniref:Hydroxysteroid 11-beta-dehydrogenase 1-like protein n=1 Tax=Branchiostoma floridae TaxID=7739 RepID=A0A9J7LBM9_BRAFL|nr:hydroxysteroid 11-beta-dehydrogenase 1-like protein [Branchiostoma floridae]
MSRLACGSLTVLLGAVAVGIYWNYDGFDPESLRGATVVITGCSSGIGEQMAYQYARLGAKILITARREERLKEVVAKAKSLGAQEAHYVAGDMGKAEDCERTIQTAKEKFGKIPWPNVTYYCSAKFALDGFFSSLRVELMKAQQDVSVTLAILGLIKTQNVIDHVKNEEVVKTAAPVDEAAMAIVRGGATRAREVYYPFYTWPTTILRALLPQVLDNIVINIS